MISTAMKELISRWLLLQVEGPLLGCPYKESPIILGSILVPRTFWKLLYPKSALFPVQTWEPLSKEVRSALPLVFFVCWAAPRLPRMPTAASLVIQNFPKPCHRMVLLILAERFLGHCLCTFGVQGTIPLVWGAHLCEMIEV